MRRHTLGMRGKGQCKGLLSLFGTRNVLPYDGFYSDFLRRSMQVSKCKAKQTSVDQQLLTPF